MLSLILSPAQNQVVQYESEQPVGTPQENCHDEDKGENNRGDLHCFLASRPNNLPGFAYGFFCKIQEIASRRRCPREQDGHDQATHQSTGAYQGRLVCQYIKRDNTRNHCTNSKGDLELVARCADGFHGVVRHTLSFSARSGGTDGGKIFLPDAACYFQTP